MIRILFVDHDLLHRSIATLAIWKAGYWNDVVSSGNRAVEAIRKNHYDLVFISLALKDMHWLAAAEAIRRQERESGRCPALLCAMSAVDDLLLRQGCHEAGIEEFIGRPSTVDELYRMIRLAESVAVCRAGLPFNNLTVA